MNRYLKVFLTSFLSLVFLLQPLTIFANTMDKDLIMNQLAELENKYGIEFFILDKEHLENMHDDLRFDTVAEFDEFLQFLFQTKRYLEESEESIIYVSDLHNPNEYGETTVYFRDLDSRRNITERTEVSWWSPNILFGMFYWKNIDFSFTYSNQNGSLELISISPVHGSWTTGFNVGSWSHRSGSGTVNSTTGGTVRANGTYTLGVDFGGLPVGFSWNDTWQRDIRIV